VLWCLLLVPIYDISANMKALSISTLFACLLVASAYPTPQEVQQAGSQTLDAIADWFSPLTNYFRNDFPAKTPSEFAGDVRDSVSEVASDVANHHFVATVNEGVIQPAVDTISSTFNSVVNTPVRELYDGAVKRMGDIDESVAGFINGRRGELILE